MNKKPKEQPSNRSIVVITTLIVFGMFGLAFLSVPLYNLFCRVTGYGGTTQIAKSLPDNPGEQSFNVRFDSNTNPNLPWDFVPLQHKVTVKTGENKLIFYTAENTSDKPTTGIATFNVTPDIAGIYFNKIQCFCFENQTLKPGEKITMPVSFFIDPDIENDQEAKNIHDITLSYTFFETKKE